ncbi:MAG: hypothetical protein JOY86_03115 [Candidatus Eremiobacteraeota bacterium]|nr:hypothetical protein [Candidatus Eremiobacteraeota bacterium]
MHALRIAIIATVAWFCLARNDARAASSERLQTVVDVSRISAGGVEADLIHRSEPLPPVAGADHWKDSRLRIYANHRLAVDDPLPVDACGITLPFDGPAIVLAGDGTHEVQLLVTLQKSCSRTGREHAGFELITYHVRKGFGNYERSVAPAASSSMLKGLPARSDGYRIAKAGNVSAQLTFEDTASRFGPVSLRIARNGVGHDYGRITMSDGSNFASVNGPFIIDLDDDGQLELVFTALSPGASCCGFSLVYAYDQALGRYRRFEKMWGKYTNSGELIRVPGSRGVEFLSHDEDYADENEVPYPDLLISPLQLWKFSDGLFVDVTRSYPKLVAQDAWEAWETMIHPGESRREDAVAIRQAACGQYLADKYMLGEGEDGWRVVEARCPDEVVDWRGVSYHLYSLLRRNLQKFGYAR